MNMVPFKDEKDLDARLAAYKGSVNNDYMNRRSYVEELEELRYFDAGDLYIGTKKNDRWHVTYYLKEQKPLDLDEALVTEIVGRRPDTSAAEAVGFRLYKMRLRLRLKEGLGEISPRVVTLDDGDFVARGIAAFDPVSGNHQSTDEIQRDVREGRVIGIPGAGFLQYSVSPTEQTIEHLYVEPSCRGRGLALELVKHYVAACIEKKRATVWTDAEGGAATLYEKAGFRKDGFHSAVMVYAPELK